MCIYSKTKGESCAIISLYVDDMFIFEIGEYCVNDTEKLLSSVIDMKDLGVAELILGIKIIRNDKDIVISQSSYIEKVLKKFDMLETILASNLMNPNFKLMNNTWSRVSQYRYSQIISYLMYDTYCT